MVQRPVAPRFVAPAALAYALGCVPILATWLGDSWPLELASHFIVLAMFGALFVALACAFWRRWLEASSGVVLAVAYAALGIGVYSRSPLARIAASRIGDPMVVAGFEHEGCAISLIAAHTYPPITPERIRDRQLAALATFAATTPASAIVAGDLNITSWSPVFRQLLGGSGLTDSRRGFGIQGTWPSGWPASMRLPIDHILVSRDIVAVHREVGPDIGSDHRPIFAELALCASMIDVAALP